VVAAKARNNIQKYVITYGCKLLQPNVITFIQYFLIPVSLLILSVGALALTPRLIVHVGVF